jgi:phosphatidylglycerophosphatase C
MSQADSPIVPAPDAGTAAPRVVVFDFDGVLIHGDAFYLFMRERYRRSPLRWLIAILCLPVLFLLLPFSRRWPVRLLIFVALLGLRERTYRAAAEAFAGQLVRRPKQFCRDGLQVLRRHQAQGDRVIVVTGCEQHLVSAILQQLGMTDLEILASQLRQGWVSMRLLRHNVRRRKVQSLAEHGVTAWQFAYGDSMNDVAMMKVASEPVLVNGSPTLCKKVEKALGRAVSRVEWI